MLDRFFMPSNKTSWEVFLFVCFTVFPIVVPNHFTIATYKIHRVDLQIINNFWAEVFKSVFVFTCFKCDIKNRALWSLFLFHWQLLIDNTIGK